MNEEAKNNRTEGNEACLQEATGRLEEKVTEWQAKHEEQAKEGGLKMNGFNKVVMVGRLTRDPKLRALPSGLSVGDLSLAVSETYKKKDGELGEHVCFVDITIWGKQAESCSQYLKKGSPVLVEGKLQLDRWETAEGEKRSRHKINASRVQFLSGKADASRGAEEPALAEVGAAGEEAPF